MKCPSCSHVNRAIATFCSKCGESMTPEPAKEEVKVEPKVVEVSNRSVGRTNFMVVTSLVVVALIVVTGFLVKTISDKNSEITKLNSEVAGLYDWSTEITSHINNISTSGQIQSATQTIPSGDTDSKIANLQNQITDISVRVTEMKLQSDGLIPSTKIQHDIDKRVAALESKPTKNGTNLTNEYLAELEMTIACLELESIGHTHASSDNLTGDYAGTWDPLGYNGGFSAACSLFHQTVKDGGNWLYTRQLRNAKKTETLKKLCPRVMTAEMKKYYERFPDVTHEGIFRICYQ